MNALKFESLPCYKLKLYNIYPSHSFESFTYSSTTLFTQFFLGLRDHIQLQGCTQNFSKFIQNLDFYGRLILYISNNYC